MNSALAWKIVIAWASLIIICLLLVQEWSVVVFVATYGFIFGGIAFRFRSKIRPLFQAIRLHNYWGFLLLAVAVSVTEEIYCWVLGNNMAHEILWVDLVMVTAIWSVWFSTWYFFLSKRFLFTEKEALMVAGAIGILYEYVGTGDVFGNPLLILASPLAIVIYATIFVLPMQLITFTGTDDRNRKYPIGIVLPFVLSLPVLLILFVVFSIAGISVD